MREIWSYTKAPTDLPSLVSSSVVGIILSDVGVNATQGELLVRSLSDGLNNELSVGIWRLGLVAGALTPCWGGC